MFLITFSYIEQVLPLQKLADMRVGRMQPFLSYYALVGTFEFYHPLLYMLSYLQIILVHSGAPSFIRKLPLQFFLSLRLIHYSNQSIELKSNHTLAAGCI